MKNTEKDILLDSQELAKGNLKVLDEKDGILLSDGSEPKTGYITLPEVAEMTVERPNIYAAIAKAQGQFDKFYKGEDNTFFKSKYLTLAQLFDGIKKILSDLGVAVLQFPTVQYPDVNEAMIAAAADSVERLAPAEQTLEKTKDKKSALSRVTVFASGVRAAAIAPLVSVRTVLALSDDQKVENVFTVKARDWDVQSVGSAVTYARRYSLQCLLGIAADEDDDGNAAVRPEPPRRFERPAPVADRDDEINEDPDNPGNFLYCSDCGIAITGHRNGVSTAAATEARYGRRLCRECGKKEEGRRREV